LHEAGSTGVFETGEGLLMGRKSFLGRPWHICSLFFLLPVLLGVLVLYGAGSDAAALPGGRVFPEESGLFPVQDPRLIALHINGDIENVKDTKEEVSMFPLRRIFEEMGYGVNWEDDNKRVILIGWGRHIILYPLNPLYAINGIVYRAASPPILENGRLVVSRDFVQQAAGVEELFWDEDRDQLRIHYKDGGRHWREEDVDIDGFPGKYPTRFLEVLLPEENRVGIGESFEIAIGAPFVKGIHSYLLRFFYNPELIKIKDIKNPSYRQAEEFHLKRINNREGVVEYTLTNLGFAEEIPPRRTLAIMEAIAFREGAVPLIGGTLHVELLDNTATRIPVAVEEKTLQIRSAR
jgi:hypothetical protein